MKFSERKFKIAIKIFDGKSVRSILKRQETKGEYEEENDDEEQPAWVKGYICITYEQLLDTYHYDSFSPNRLVEDVAKEGFDLTGIFHPELGEFECLWSRSVFESKANIFVESYEKWLDEEEEKDALKKQARIKK